MKRVISTRQFNHLTLFVWREEHREAAYYYSSPTMTPIFPSHDFYLSFLCCSLQQFHEVYRSQMGNHMKLGDKYQPVL